MPCEPDVQPFARGRVAVRNRDRSGSRRHLAAMSVLAATLFLPGCATTPGPPPLPPLQTVEHVNLQRYLGTWYENRQLPAVVSEGVHRHDGHLHDARRWADRRPEPLPQGFA